MQRIAKKLIFSRFSAVHGTIPRSTLYKNLFSTQSHHQHVYREDWTTPTFTYESAAFPNPVRTDTVFPVTVIFVWIFPFRTPPFRMRLLLRIHPLRTHPLRNRSCLARMVRTQPLRTRPLRTHPCKTGTLRLGQQPWNSLFTNVGHRDCGDHDFTGLSNLDSISQQNHPNRWF